MKPDLKETTDQLVDALVQAGALQRPENKFESMEQYTDRFRAMLQEKMVLFQKTLRKGYEVIIRTLSEEKKGEVDKYRLTEERLAALKSQDKLEKLAKEAGTFQEFLGYSDEMMLCMYGIATDLFKRNSFEESVQVYTFVSTLNPYCSQFWLGLGCAYEKCGKSEEAIAAYRLGILTDIESIDPYVYLGRCCLAHHRETEAIEVFQLGIKLANDNPEREAMQKLRLDLEKLIDHLNKKMSGGK
jgi:tetratricopeptide (TPR) repeat protein